MTTQQQPRPIQTVGLPRPAKPDYDGLFLEPQLPVTEDPAVEAEDRTAPWDDQGA